MNRRKLLAIGGVSIASIAGCFGLGQTMSSEDTGGTSDKSSNQGGENPDISAEQVNSTDTPPSEREETTPDTENTTRKESDEAPQENPETVNESAQDTPDSEPIQAVEIVDHQLVYDEAEDPNYGQDELYATGTLRNTSAHPITDVTVEGRITVSGEEISHAQTQYAHLPANGELPLDILFEFDERAIDGHYELMVTAAQWA